MSNSTSRPNYSQDARGLVYGVGFTIMQLSAICSIYIIVRIVSRWVRLGKRPITLRFPFYIAITDLMLYGSLMADQLHDVIFSKNWDEPMCKITATAVSISGFSNMMLVCSVTFITFSTIVLGKHVDLGAGDWKLLLTVAIFAILMGFVTIPSAGSSWYWCYEEMFANNKTIQILVILVEVTLFLLTFFFAVKVWIVLMNAQNAVRELESGSTNRESISVFDKYTVSTTAKPQRNYKRERLLEVAARKIMTFVLNYFIQWSGTTPYILMSVFDIYEDWMIVLCTIGMNCGGILNMIGFIRNEGWVDHEDSTKMVSF
ncbi:hypothetical protein HDV06_006375 [Boothiomyces sp. JEL0866]|nr:hypothetical protein HDV06_006375 [Boothiomyces sp. JEL0866]